MQPETKWFLTVIHLILLMMGVLIGVMEWAKIGDAGDNPAGKWIGLVLTVYALLQLALVRIARS